MSKIVAKHICSTCFYKHFGKFIEIHFNKLFCYDKIKEKNVVGLWSLDVIKWGIQNNKQRYKCKNCEILFTSSNTGVSQKNRKVWFREWIIENKHLHN